VWLATERNEVVQVACAEPFNATAEHPEIGVPSAEKAISPPAIPLAGATALTVAVKVTGLPYPEGFRFDESTVDVEAWSTN
jgi:hypothetical protein